MTGHELSQNKVIASTSGIPLLNTETRNALKSQSFVRPERIKEMLNMFQETVVQVV